MALFAVTFVRFLLIALWLLVLARVILSWIDPVGRTQVGGYVVRTTEPLLAPVRRMLPRTGMLDFAPLVVMLILGALVRAVG